MVDTPIPFAVRTAAARFKKDRAEYYRYLASMLESAKGTIKIADIFERDSQRYVGKARGVLSTYWAAEYMANGANLARAWRGTFPDDEMAIIAVSSDAGDGALLTALKDISRIAKLADKVKKEVISTMMAAVIGLTIAIVMLTIFPIFSTGKLQEVFGNIPLSEWGPKGKAFIAHAERVKSYGIYAVILFGFVVFYFSWTVNNLIGPVRDWLDANNSIYKTIRDIKGALFLATMSTLTRKRGNVMYTLIDSLNALSQSARSPWFKWRLAEIANIMETNGATGSEAFNTNLLSQEMYFYLRDTQEARGFSEGFDETGKYVEENVVDRIVKNMTIYRWVLLLTGVAMVVLVIGWQFSVIYEMKGVMLTYYSSR